MVKGIRRQTIRRKRCKKIWSQKSSCSRRYEELVNGREKGRGLGERRETILDRWGRTSREPTGSLLQ
nr:hypothetical protein Iba_chr14cCG13030 [Ipomoea batatas]GMD91475.1 hypothetical protein Iba_chr14dCG19740 [Ipomoea batatas]